MNVPFILSAASLCIVVISFFFCRWYIARKTAASELLADYRTEVYRLIAEIDAAADRDSLLVEERIKTLNKLMDDTDRRISVYMRELQRSRDGEAMYTSLGRGIRAALDSRTPPEERTRTAPENGTRTGERVDEQMLHGVGPKKAPTTINSEGRERVIEENADAATKSEGPPPEPQEPPASRKRNAKKPKVKVQIAAMAAQGLPSEKIASRLKLSIAEVELALNLLHRNPHE
jgi:hypothetical protein